MFLQRANWTFGPKLPTTANSYNNYVSLSAWAPVSQVSMEQNLNFSLDMPLLKPFRVLIGNLAKKLKAEIHSLDHPNSIKI